MWKCENCNTSINIKISYPVYCSCGWTTHENGLVLKTEEGAHFIQEKIMVSDFVQAERASFCKKCDQCADSESGFICSKTGESIDDKVLWADSICPLKKWISLKTQSNGGCGC